MHWNSLLLLAKTFLNAFKSRQEKMTRKHETKQRNEFMFVIIVRNISDFTLEQFFWLLHTFVIRDVRDLLSFHIGISFGWKYFYDCHSLDIYYKSSRIEMKRSLKEIKVSYQKMQTLQRRNSVTLFRFSQLDSSRDYDCRAHQKIATGTE